MFNKSELAQGLQYIKHLRHTAPDQPVKDRHTMNQTTQSILQEIAQTGQAVIINTRTRELHAALDLIKAGICHRSNTLPDYFIIKFGTRTTI